MQYFFRYFDGNDYFCVFSIAIIMKPNDILTLFIESLGDDGDGIATVGKMTVYVPNALPGDRVRAVVVDVAKSYAHAEIVTMLRCSKDGTAPFCRHYKECGGCQIQRMNWRKQLIFKRKRVIENLQMAGVLTEEDFVPGAISCAYNFGFRNKAIFPVAKNAEGKIVAGFYERRSHNIVPVLECRIGIKENIPILNAIIEYLRDCNIEPYDEATHTGTVRYIMIRKAFETEQIMVSIVINGQSLPHHNVLIDKLLKVTEKIKSVSLTVNCDNTNRIRGNEVINLLGDGYITEIIDGVRYRISPLAFFQVNTPQTLKLYRLVFDFAALTGNETVFDLYCGVGTIGLFLARSARKVIGVETIAQAVEDAKHNAAINHIFNADFYEGKAEEIIPDLINNKGVKADVVIVDPPRKGCDKVLIDSIIKMRPQRIVYVSCDPKSLARDLKILQDNGFKTKHVQPVDMFPHTVHVETVALVTI